MKYSVTKILAGLVALTTLSGYAQYTGALAQSSRPAVSKPMQNVHPLALKDTPLPVQQSVRQRSVGAVVENVDQANWNGETVYSVVVSNHGQTSQYIFDQNGKVLSEPGKAISEAAGAELNHSKQPDTETQHDGHILQHPK